MVLLWYIDIASHCESWDLAAYSRLDPLFPYVEKSPTEKGFPASPRLPPFDYGLFIRPQICCWELKRLIQSILECAQAGGKQWKWIRAC